MGNVAVEAPLKRGSPGLVGLMLLATGLGEPVIKHNLHGRQKLKYKGTKDL